MALLQNGYLAVDNNLGTVAITTLPGAFQADVVLRMNRSDFLKGKSPLECLNNEDRFIVALVQATGQSIQQGLGYQPANFINPVDVEMI
jgi:hypothetical protein